MGVKQEVIVGRVLSEVESNIKSKVIEYCKSIENVPVYKRDCDLVERVSILERDLYSTRRALNLLVIILNGYVIPEGMVEMLRIPFDNDLTKDSKDK